MKIFLDDLRRTPIGWDRCYTVKQVQKFLCDTLLGFGEEITDMSLDHDLGASYLCSLCYEDGRERDTCTLEMCRCTCHDTVANFPTGYDLVKWMAQHDMWPTKKPIVHSANPAGRVNMNAVIDQSWHPPDER